MNGLRETGIPDKYLQEREKRLRSDGTSQFVELALSDKFKQLETDPWVDHDALNNAQHVLNDGDDIKFLLLGAGYGALVLAARLVEAGFDPASIRFVDAAGGFGGTWYWNRYPGLMCDIESYIYMPLLEELGHMPTFKYAYGNELREHAEHIAEHYGLKNNGSFRTVYHEAQWLDDQKRWKVGLREYRGPDEPERSFWVYSQFLCQAAGAIVSPQIPLLPGMDTFQGTMFHTARWNYPVTGGTPTDWTMDKLKDKRVGIIGTGATAIQVVPELAKWAKHLYVFQRTPSSVDVRGQRRTDPIEWKTKIATGKGWQQARAMNFNLIMVNTPEGPDLVADGWCKMPAYCGINGAPTPTFITPDKVPDHIAALNAVDLPRAERVRARVDEIVQDPATAENLKAWYPVWCKRPTFHDDYLPAFNKPNVTLVDTDGKGVDSMTATGVIANGKEYPIDILVLSTGYIVGLVAGSGCPASRGNFRVTGRDGRDMEAKWREEGCSTLHGLASNGFPNFFFLPGLSQLGFTANFMSALDTVSKQVAWIVAQAHKDVDRPGQVVVEVEKDAEERWADEVVKRSGWFAAVPGCTPGYFNSQGEHARLKDPVEELKAARASAWGEGYVSYINLLKDWRAKGDLEGIHVTTGQSE